VRITSDQSLPAAERSWRAFLRRFLDAGHAYVVSFQAPPLPEPVTGVPVNTALPSILGTPALGETLTTVSGSWSNTPTSYTYQWEDCDTSGQSCSPIVRRWAELDRRVVAVTLRGNGGRADAVAAGAEVAAVRGEAQRAPSKH
jgi:hypothetical protein